MPDYLPWPEFLCVDFEAMSSKYSPGSWMKLLVAGKANPPEKYNECYTPEKALLSAWIAYAPGAQIRDYDYLSWEFTQFKTKFLWIEFSLFLVQSGFYRKFNLI